MKIIFSNNFQNALQEIYDYISLDSNERAFKFCEELYDQISKFTFMPKRCRKSLLFDDENVRDLIFKGYVLPFKITDESVKILYIYKANLPKIKEEK